MSTEQLQSMEPDAERIRWIKGDTIGKGTLSKVFLALNVDSGEMIAVKQHDLLTKSSPDIAQRRKSLIKLIKTQIAVAHGLQHPNIVQHLGYQETAISFNVFLEYVPGGSLRGVMMKIGPFSEVVVKSFTSQILNGLEYLHWRGIWHGDLHSGHILIDSMGVCKLSNIGIRDEAVDVTVESMNHGTAAIPDAVGFWLAPEILSAGKDGQSDKTDIWSLGCVIVEMFTGHRPWPEDDVRSIATRVSETSDTPTTTQLEGGDQAFVNLFFERDAAKRPTAVALRVHPFLKLPSDWQFTSFN